MAKNISDLLADILSAASWMCRRADKASHARFDNHAHSVSDNRKIASLLRSIELPDLVTASVQEYEDLAVELARDPPRLAEVKQRLARNRLTAPLFDSRAFVRNIESAYLNIYERHRAGMPADHIYLTGR